MQEELIIDKNNILEYLSDIVTSMDINGDSQFGRQLKVSLGLMDLVIDALKGSKQRRPTLLDAIVHKISDIPLPKRVSPLQDNRIFGIELIVDTRIKGASICKNY